VVAEDQAILQDGVKASIAKNLDQPAPAPQAQPEKAEVK